MMKPLTIIDDVLRWVRGLSRIVIVPEQEDPIKWFARYRHKKIWQRRDWQKGLWFGAAIMIVLATALKILGLL